MDKIRNIKHQLLADRVAIYQYHNGEHSITNNPFLKLSMTHEVVKWDVETIIGKDGTYKVPTSLFAHWNTQIFEKEVVRCPCVEDLKNDAIMRPAHQILSRLGIKATYWFPLESLNGKITGFIAVDFLQPYELSELNIELAKSEFAKVGTLLCEPTDTLNTVDFSSR